MTDLYRMIEELHEAVKPLRRDVMLRRPYGRLIDGMNKMAEAYKVTSIYLRSVFDVEPIESGDLVEISAYGEPSRLYKIGEGSTADNWLVEAQ